MRSVIIASSLIFVYAFTAFAQAPQVVSVTPAQNEVSAPITSNITATFDIDMDPTTIDNSTFSVYSRTYGYLPGTITYDQPTRTATFDPARDFFHGDVITATLTNGVGSLGGTPMDRGFSWTFTVIAGGVGAFGAYAEYDMNYHTNSIFIADLNMDDYPDVISGDISVFLNGGDGTFPARTDYYFEAVDLETIYAADFDHDGFIDFAVGSSGGLFGIFSNNGDGTFSQVVNHQIGVDVGRICVADLDLDTDLDILAHICDFQQFGQIYIYFNDGYGNFDLDSVTAINVGPGYNPMSLFIRDLNNDGTPDIVFTAQSIGILLNNGDCTFAGPSYYIVSRSYVNAGGADFNNDNFVDLAATNYYGQGLFTFINQGDGTYIQDSSYSVDSRPYSVFASDLNGDQRLDVTVGSVKYESTFNTFLYYNNGDGTFDLNSQFNIADDNTVLGVFTSDLDLDGDLDLVTSNKHTETIAVLKNLPACGYVTGDVNGDGGYNGLDIIYAVNYFKGGDPPVYDECDCPVGGFWYVAGDVNASCDFNGLDITYGVNYFKGGDAPQPCPECPPAQ